MNKRNYVLLTITIILLIISVTFLIMVGVDNVVDFIILAILGVDITCFPCAYCYHYDKYKRNEWNFLYGFPARFGLLILLFTSPYFLILYIYHSLIGKK